MSSLEKLMLDHSPDIMLLVEPTELRIIMANRATGQLLGYSEEQLLTMPITDIESSLQDVFYWEDVRSGQYLNIEAQEGLYQCADTSLLTVSKSVRVVDHEGRRLLLIRAKDMRNERQVEDALEQTLSQLRATLESTGNGILVIDWQGRIASMNRLFSAMWQIPEELLLDRRDADILTLICQQVIDEALCRSRLETIVDRIETEDVFRLRDGRVFECKSRPQYLGERIVGRVFGFNDITQRTQGEEALRDSRDRLEERVRERTTDLQAANAHLQAEKQRQEELIRKLEEAQNQLLQSEKMASIGQLAAGVAHEINNPVGFVSSNLGTLQRYINNMLRLLAAYEESEETMVDAVLADIRRLKKEIDAAYLREDVVVLLSESLDGLQRVKRIVQDLKNFSHVDRSEHEVANLEAGMESTLNVVWNELKYKAKVVKEYGNIPAIECVPSQLNQVFMNLLVNAAHAIEEQGVITISSGHDDTLVWVEVSDTGKGIAPEHLGRIFEPFFTTKPVGKGTGLGLSLSYSIVNKHGGHIDVRSQVGQGSTFRVVLPRTLTAVADATN
ncbi:MAG: histidine kinase [Betaproteobacteria bacterium HGW-Betaproteobacteria-7]|jgi:PAS domain S-box-containing protein|nr:MAG: histidine kinase [Betaproteobacteria bacterium HGW-Betaproteobacteria-7]